MFNNLGGLPSDNGLRENLRRKWNSLDPKDQKRLDRKRLSQDELWRELNNKSGSTFSEVFQFELDALQTGLVRPDLGTGPAALDKVIARAHTMKLSGLAFSGGGIRSATFNLGVVQALAEMRLLRQFDYLSTVSGGGYIGGWLSKLIMEHRGKVEEVEELLAGRCDGTVPREEPAPIQYLRQYSNYLTPRRGLFSADTWTVVCTYLRNAALNLSMFTAWIAAFLLIPRIVTWGIEQSQHVELTWLAISLFAASVYFVALSIYREDAYVAKGVFAQTSGRVVVFVCLPLMVSALLGSIEVWQNRFELSAFWREISSLDAQASRYLWLLAPGLVDFTAWYFGLATAFFLNRRDEEKTEYKRNLPKSIVECFARLICAVIAYGAASILLLLIVSEFVRHGWEASYAVVIATFGMPALLTLFSIGAILLIGLMGRMYPDKTREWWARQSAWTTIISLAWLTVFGFTFYAPPILHWAFVTHVEATSLSTLFSSLLVLVGLKAGRDDENKRNGLRAILTRYLAYAAPYAFTILLLGAMSYSLHIMVSGPVQLTPERSLGAFITQYTLKPQNITAIAFLSLGLLSAGIILGWRVDINKFSLYMMYRMRLVRAYFGASCAQSRKPHPFTGFDPNDDPALDKLLCKKFSCEQVQSRPTSVEIEQEGGEALRLQRPYHLINASVNLVGGRELAWQDRKAANFFFSPAFCGFETPTMPNGDTVSPPPLARCFSPNHRIRLDIDISVVER